MKEFIVFAAGAAIGSVITWKVLKDKYEKLAQEEIDSVKEAFSRREKKLNSDLDEANNQVIEAKKDIKKAEAKAYKQITQEIAIFKETK